MTKEYAKSGDLVELISGKIVKVIKSLDRSIVYKSDGANFNARHGHYKIKVAA